MMKRNAPRGFSLIELLLAIFILGIGIVSIATLFPAGIAQQQKTSDDVIGPIVARNALTILRSKLEQEDFGGAEPFEPFEQWNPTLCGFGGFINVNLWPTICGDWMWRRPALVQADYGNTDDYQAMSVRGAIDIFATPTTQILPGQRPALVEIWTPNSNSVPGIPYNKERYPDIPVYNNPDEPPVRFDLDVPTMRILAGERQYPMWSGSAIDRPQAKYYWDCMFRRFEGRILVAIFVYRVVDPSTDEAYTIDTEGIETPNLPYTVNVTNGSSTGSWNAFPGSEELANSQLDDPTLPSGQWQFPGQWIVDQNGNVHRVQRGRRRVNNTSPVLLTERPFELPVYESIDYPNSDTTGVNVHWWDKDIDNNLNASGFVQEGVVTDIWFIPTSDLQGRKLIPVFALVEGL